MSTREVASAVVAALGRGSAGLRRRRPPSPSNPAGGEPQRPAVDAGPSRRRIFTQQRPSDEDGSGSDWNLWELERRARAYAGADSVPEEWAATFRSLREFARSDGRLPAEFDSLVRESFPELTRAPT